jgi:glycosyltransferase involved in cell wall biosynthesis
VLLSHTYKDFELVIVDDGSTDNSVLEVRKFEDSRIRLIRQKNEGVSSARNKAINEAKHDYIGFLDADDAWKPNFLETIKKLIQQYPKAGAYATSYEIQREDGTIVKSLSEGSFKKNWQGLIDDYFKYSLKAPLISASSVVIPKSVFSNIGFFPLGIKRGEDLDMWIKIALNYDIVYLNQICATYFYDTDNRACERKGKLTNSSASYAEDTLAKAKKAGNYSIFFEEYMIKSVITKARYLIDEDKRKEARKLLYKYSYTKLNKNYLIKTYILSFMPKSSFNRILCLKGKMRKKLKDFISD